MSEYQYHEWQTVDRLLTAQEQHAVDELSSHIEVSASRAVVTYNWSSFRHNPQEVLLNYFDAYFYLDDWGSLRLMFRFPTGLLDTADILPYCTGEMVSFTTHGAYQVLDIDFSVEDDGELLETEASLSDFIALRGDLLQGDFRLLYLAWLVDESGYADEDYEDNQEDDYDESEDDESEDNVSEGDNEIEPPVPAGLKKLTPALQNFARVFGIDHFLIQAAAETSPDPKKMMPVDYRSLINQLSRKECDDFLVRLAEGDATVSLALRKRLNALLPTQESAQIASRRTRAQIDEHAKQLRTAASRRQAAEVRKKHAAAMKALAAREDQAWQEVENLLTNERKIASVYDHATAQIDQLRQLAEFQQTPDVFRSHLHRLVEKFGSRPALMERWKSKGWI